MTAQDLSEKLKTIADGAKALRDAGVVGRVTIDGVSFELAEPADPTIPVSVSSPANVLDDPDTYGGFIPQRRNIDGPPSTEDDGDD